MQYITCVSPGLSLIYTGLQYTNIYKPKSDVLLLEFRLFFIHMRVSPPIKV